MLLKSLIRRLLKVKSHLELLFPLICPFTSSILISMAERSKLLSVVNQENANGKR
jgi:hypothetical protein